MNDTMRRKNKGKPGKPFGRIDRSGHASGFRLDGVLRRFFSAPLKEDSPVRRLAWAVLFLALLSLLFASSSLPLRLEISPGEPAPQSIKAPMELVDRPATERLQAEARSQVPEVFDHDQTVALSAAETASQVFASIRQLRALEDEALISEEGPSAEGLRRLGSVLQSMVAVDLDDDQLTTLFLASDEALYRAEELNENFLSFIFAQGVKPGSLRSFQEQLRENFSRSDLPPDLSQVMAHIGVSLLRPNLVYNAEETELRRQQAADQVEPVTILRGQVLVSDGQVVGMDDLVRLRDAGILGDEGPWRVYLGAGLLAFLMIVLLGGYCYRLERIVFDKESQIVLVGLVFLVTLFISRLVMVVSPFLAPIGAGTILLTVLVSGHVAIVVGFLMALGMALISGGDIAVTLVAFAGATVAAIVSSNIKERNDLMLAGLAVGFANVLILLSYQQLEGVFSITDALIWQDLLWSAGNGLLTAVLAIGSLPFLEGLFGILTPVKLLELASPTQPLLRRLLEEAPGTYHHSMLVANMAEPAVEAVGGDPLLARVGAYYHDIGKARRPYFFIENQFGGDNPHDKLSPNLSALIVISHVKDGIDMARDAGLPQSVIDFISGHHGTTLASYFYARAHEAAEGTEIEKSGFQYPGPRPETKETAVVMLADAVEASVRSLARPTPDRIRAMVRDIIHNRLEDGQLDKCDLTLKDLYRVADVFTQVLTGAFHRRLEYPESVLRAMKEEENADDHSGGDSGAGKGP